MAYAFKSDDGHAKIGGNPSKQEVAAGEAKNPADEWDPDRETWDDFCYRTQ